MVSDCVTSTGLTGLGPEGVRPPAPGRKTRVPGRLNAVAPGFLVHEMDQFSGQRFLVDAGAISSSPSAVPGSSGQAASSPLAVPGSIGQAASSPSAGPDPFGQAATPTQEVFDSKLILNGHFLDSTELFSEKFLRQIFGTMSAAEHFSPRHNTSAVTGPHGRVASSSSAVPGPHSQQASSSSAVPGPHGWAACSPSAVPGPHSWAASSS